MTAKELGVSIRRKEKYGTLPNNEFSVLHEGRSDFWHFVEKYNQDEDSILLYGVLVCEFDTAVLMKISRSFFPPVFSLSQH
jgi:hypothetical protein